MQHLRCVNAHYGRVLFSAYQMKDLADTTLVQIVDEFAERQHRGWLTAREQHEFHAALALLEERGRGSRKACFCDECVRWRTQVLLELGR